MTLNTAFDLKDIIEALAFIAAAVSVWVQLRGIQNQMWLNTFTEYTRRYDEAMTTMPFEARGIGVPVEVNGLSDDLRKSVLTAMRRYFNLCSEERYLHQRGRIDSKTWNIWKTGIRDSACGPFFASAWRCLAAEYEFYPDFRDFMNDLVKGQESRVTETADDKSDSGASA